MAQLSGISSWFPQIETNTVTIYCSFSLTRFQTADELKTLLKNAIDTTQSIKIIPIENELEQMKKSNSVFVFEGNIQSFQQQQQQQQQLEGHHDIVQPYINLDSYYPPINQPNPQPAINDLSINYQDFNQLRVQPSINPIQFYHQEDPVSSIGNTNSIPNQNSFFDQIQIENENWYETTSLSPQIQTENEDHINDQNPQVDLDLSLSLSLDWMNENDPQEQYYRMVQWVNQQPFSRAHRKACVYPNCPYTTSNKVDYLDHLNLVHIKYELEQCPYCPQKFKTTRKLTHHIRKRHEEERKKNIK